MPLKIVDWQYGNKKIIFFVIVYGYEVSLKCYCIGVATNFFEIKNFQSRVLWVIILKKHYL